MSNPTTPIPDPNGPPALSDRIEASCKLIAAVSAKVLVIGSVAGAAAFVAFVALSAAPRRTSGALRSQRIKWEDRQNQIAEAQCQSTPADNSTPTLQPPEEPHE